MANRQFTQFGLTLEKRVVSIYAKVAIGASGAPTLSTANSKGVTSVSRNSAGDYTFTFQDRYVKLMSIKMTAQSSTGLPAAPIVGVKANSISTARTLKLVTTTAGGGSATDPGNGETLFFEFVFGDSTAT